MEQKLMEFETAKEQVFGALIARKLDRQQMLAVLEQVHSKVFDLPYLPEGEGVWEKAIQKERAKLLKVSAG